MRKVTCWLRQKLVWTLTGVIALFSWCSTQFTTCSNQTILVVTRIVGNNVNQVATLEVASFVANLFYEGPDDPFSTPGAGGEAGKLTHAVLKRGEKLFGEALSKIVKKADDIIKSSRTWANPQIQEGKRAIQKKIGHASAGNYQSAFSNIDFTQENAELLINKIIDKADAIVIRPYLTKIYNSAGQGVSIETRTGKFVGLVERSLEKEL